MIASEAGNEEILEAIVVVISHCNPVGISEIGIQPRSRRGIRKGSIAVVVVERAMRAVGDFGAGPGWAALNEDDVGPSVAVVIHKRASGRSAFYIVELVSFGPVRVCE